MLSCVAFPNYHDHNITIIEYLQKYTDIKDNLTRAWQVDAIYIASLLLSTTGIIPHKKKLLDVFKLLALVYMIYSDVENCNTQYVPYNSKVFSRIMNK